MRMKNQFLPLAEEFFIQGYYRSAEHQTSSINFQLKRKTSTRKLHAKVCPARIIHTTIKHPAFLEIYRKKSAGRRSNTHRRALADEIFAGKSFRNGAALAVCT